MSHTPTPLRAPTPPLIAVLGALALFWIIGPVLALGIRVPWERLGTILSEPETLELLRVTLTAAVLSSLVTLFLGLPLAMWIQRARRGASLVRLFVLLPLAMPPVVAGLALTAMIGRRGILAPVLDATGIQFAFEFAGVVASHVYVALPFVVVTLDTALRQIDREIPASAAGIGMSPGQVIRRIIIPAITPSIATAAGLAFARSLGEFGTTLTFAGSMPGVTRTMSLGIYLEREIDQEAAYALSAVLIALAILSLVLASLPGLLRKKHEPVARAIGPIDSEALRRLTRPASGGVEVEIDGTEIPANCLTAVVGPNGSGKTTLVGQIAGRLSGAEVRIGDQLVDKPGARAVPAHKRGVVLLTQRPGLPTTTTVFGAIDMVASDTRHARELIKAAGLENLAETPVPALSGGQAAQVALTRALATRPAVLILDEPLAAIDVAAGRAWRQVLRAIAPDRTTILVTHNPLDLEGLSEHIVVMEQGKLLSTGPTREQLSTPATTFMSTLFGTNRIAGSITTQQDGIVCCDALGLPVHGVWADPSITPDAPREGLPTIATFPPSATTLRLPTPHAEGDSTINVWPGTVEAIDIAPAQPNVTVTVSLGTTSIFATASRHDVLDMELEFGSNVECLTRPQDILIRLQSA